MVLFYYCNYVCLYQYYILEVFYTTILIFHKAKVSLVIKLKKHIQENKISTNFLS